MIYSKTSQISSKSQNGQVRLHGEALTQDKVYYKHATELCYYILVYSIEKNPNHIISISINQTSIPEMSYFALVMSQGGGIYTGYCDIFSF